ncbi:proton channel OTOP2-like [Mantella aurantiaca]
MKVEDSVDLLPIFKRLVLNMGDIGVDDISTVIPSSSESDAKFEKTSMDHDPENESESPVVWKKGGRLFSGLLGLNVLLLASVLVSSAAFGDIAVVEREVLSLLCILMGLTACWMIVYLTWTAKKKNYRNLKDSHAGPIWLRVGLAAFGVCTLVLDVLKIGKSASLMHCESPIKIVYPVFQGLFVVIQTYFLWVSSKDCIQIHMNFTRCGLMLTLSTNLSIWMAAVTEESLHQTPSDGSSGGHRMLRGSPGCDCDTAVCKSFETGYYYLYPFNIEYSLFASAMSYVMWKNVGRVMHQDSHSTHHSLRLPRLFMGLTCGVGILVAGLAIFIIYEIDVSSARYKEQALRMFYIFSIVALGLMSLGAFVGTIFFRLDKREASSHKNPTRSLDVGLLIIAALGKYVISYFSVIAIIAKSAETLMDILNLVYSLLMIVQHTFQNIFIIEGLHREPFHNGHHDHHNMAEYNAGGEVYTNAVATASQGNHLEGEHGHEVDTNHHGTLPHSTSRRNHIGWKRKVVKEISLFLLLSNIIFWIMPAFGARPEFENDRELIFYGDPMWTAIVNIGLPFGIFYRMHAVASLLEVYVIS